VAFGSALGDVLFEIVAFGSALINPLLTNKTKHTRTRIHI